MFSATAAYYAGSFVADPYRLPRKKHGRQSTTRPRPPKVRPTPLPKPPPTHSKSRSRSKSPVKSKSKDKSLSRSTSPVKSKSQDKSRSRSKPPPTLSKSRSRSTPHVKSQSKDKSRSRSKPMVPPSILELARDTVINCNNNFASVLQYPDVTVQMQLYLEPISCSHPHYSKTIVNEFEGIYKHPLVSILMYKHNFEILASTLQRLHPNSEYSVVSQELEEWGYAPSAEKNKNRKLTIAIPRGKKCMQMSQALNEYFVIIYNSKGYIDSIFAPFMLAFFRAKAFNGIADRVLPNVELGPKKDSNRLSLYWSLWFMHVRLSQPATILSDEQLLALPLQFPLHQRTDLIDGFMDKLMFNVRLEFRRHQFISPTADDFEDEEGFQALSLHTHTGVLLGFWHLSTGYEVRPNKKGFKHHEIELQPNQDADPAPTFVLASQLQKCAAAGSCHEFQLSDDLAAVLYKNKNHLYNQKNFLDAAFRFLLNHHKECIITTFVLQLRYDNVQKVYTYNDMQTNTAFNWARLTTTLQNSKCVSKIVGLYFNLFIIGKNETHANMLFFNQNGIVKIIEHYEPHGSVYMSDERDWKLYDVLEEQFKKVLPEYTYQQPKTLCPNPNYGFQRKLGWERGEEALKGTCAMWSLYFLNDRLQHPDQSAYEVYRNTYQQLKGRVINDEIRAFIILLAKHLKLRLEPMQCSLRLDDSLFLFLSDKFKPPYTTEVKKLAKKIHYIEKGGIKFYNMIEAKVDANTFVAMYIDVAKQPKLSEIEKEVVRNISIESQPQLKYFTAGCFKPKY
jgi:hypothetical protein